MRPDLMMLPAIQLVPSIPRAQAPRPPSPFFQGKDGGNPHWCDALVPVLRSNPSSPERPGSPENHTVEMAFQAFAQADGTGAEGFDSGPAMRDDIRDALRRARSVLDLSARKEVERMLVQAKAQVDAIERNRRHLQDTLNMVLDLINPEAARLGPGGHASPD